MPRFVLTGHPHDPKLRAEYGFDSDPAIGYFVECYSADASEALLIYDASRGDHNSLSEALQLFAEMGFFNAQDLDDALETPASEPGRETDAQAGSLAEVIANFRGATGKS